MDENVTPLAPSVDNEDDRSASPEEKAALRDYVEKSEQAETNANGEDHKNEIPSPPIEVQDPNVGVQLVRMTEEPEQHIGEPIPDPWNEQDWSEPKPADQEKSSE